MNFPAPVPELPVTSVEVAADYYVRHLGFTLDWGDEAGGIAGISRGACRLFLTNPDFRRHWGTQAPVLFWLNLNSKTEVDGLHREWTATGATIVSPPEDKPWLLREFTAADPDGNFIRVFHDFHNDLPNPSL